MINQARQGAPGAGRTATSRHFKLFTAIATTGAIIAGLLGTLVAPASATTPTTTSTAAVVPGSPAYSGEQVNFVAEVAAASGVPEGTVTFSVVSPKRGAPHTSSSVTLCSSTLLAHHFGTPGHALSYGLAGCSSSQAPVGDDNVTASYAGDAAYAPSSAVSSLVVYARTTTTAVTVSPAVAGQGSLVTYSATLTGGGPSPTGSVTFSLLGTTGDIHGTYTETTQQCIAAVSNGSASCRARAPENVGLEEEVVGSEDDVTATYVPTGAAHLGSAGHASLAVMWFTGGDGANSASLDGSVLNAVSCASDKFCVVVDQYGDEITYSNGHWRPADRVDPGTEGYGLTAVSCPTTKFCAAVGADGGDGSGSVVMYNGSSWSAPQTIAPSPPSPEGYTGLVAVSCASATYCMAADSYGNAYYYNGSSWSAPVSLNLPGPDDHVTSLSCTRPEDCGAVTYDGYYSLLVGSQPGLFLPPHAGGVSYLSSVSCSSATNCTGVGNGAGTYSGAIFTTAGGHVLQNSLPLEGVSCPTTTFCVAVGGADADNNSTSPIELTETGSSWSPMVEIGAVNPELSSVSCPSVNFCMAVGYTQVIIGTASTPPSSSGPSGQPGSTPPCVACGKNLIENPGAEAGPGTGSTDSVPVPDWTTTGMFTAVQYAWSGGDLTATTPGPPDRGKNYFCGGYAGGVLATGSQTVQIAAGALVHGTTTYTLSGWLGGYGPQTDNATLNAEFETASGTKLGTASVGPVTPKQRDDNSELLHLSSSGTVPAGTRQVVVTLVFHRHEGAYDDGDADNLSLVFS